MPNADFSASTRQKIRVKADGMFADGNRRMLHLNEGFETINALLARQTANVDPLQDPRKDDQVEVTYVQKLNQTVTDPCTDDCNFNGEQAGTYAKTYNLADCVQTNFSINDAVFRGNDHELEEELAVQLMEADYALTKQFNTKAVAFLNSNIGTSERTVAIATANDASGVVVPQANWNTSMFAHLSLLARYNGMPSSFIIGGSELWVQDWLTTRDTSDGAQGRLNRFGTFDIFYDLEGFITDTENPLYMVDASAYAVAIKNRVQGTRDLGYEGRGESTWQSRFLPGVTWDVFTRKTCTSPGQTTTHYQLRARTGLFTAPADQAINTNTGILKVKQS